MLGWLQVPTVLSQMKLPTYRGKKAHAPYPATTRSKKKGVDMFKWRRLGWCRHFAYTNECPHMLRTSTPWSCSWCTAIVMASLAPAHGTGRAQCPGKPRSKGPANLFEATDHWAATDNLLQTRHGEPPCTWYRRVTRNLRFVVLHWICECVMVCIKRQITTYTCPRVYHTHMPQNRYSNRKMMIHNISQYALLISTLSKIGPRRTPQIPRIPRVTACRGGNCNVPFSKLHWNREPTRASFMKLLPQRYDRVQQISTRQITLHHTG